MATFMSSWSVNRDTSVWSHLWREMLDRMQYGLVECDDEDCDWCHKTESFVKEIRWRLNEPPEENRERWTKVHRVSFHADDLTACHMKIPKFPYMMDYDGDVPKDAPRCKRCIKSTE